MKGTVVSRSFTVLLSTRTSRGTERLASERSTN